MVPKNKRHDSKLLFVHLPFVIAARISDFIDKCPRSCVRSYGTDIIRSAKFTARYIKMANETELSDNSTKYRIREENLFKGLNYLQEPSLLWRLSSNACPRRSKIVWLMKFKAYSI